MATSCAPRVLGALSLLTLLCLRGLLAETDPPSPPPPTGHLRPIGDHRPADIDVAELSSAISGERFFNEFVSQDKPVIFRGVASDWPAASKWTDAALAADFGDMEVKIEPASYTESDMAAGSLGIGRDTIKEVVTADRGHCIMGELPSAMYKDVLVHPVLSCGELSRSIAEVDWRLCGSWRSQLMRDGLHTLTCLLETDERWILIGGNESHNVYVEPSGRYDLSGLSPIDVDSVNLTEFSRFSNVRYARVDLHAGDCLFVPAGQYHQVKTSGIRDLSVSIMFGRVDKFSAEECKGAPLVTKPLDEYDVLWRWNGTGAMDMGRGDDYFFKTLFKNRMTGKKPAVSMKGLRRLLTEDMNWEMTDDEQQKATDIMNLLDVDKDGSISTADLDAVERHVYRNVSYLVEGETDLQNTYDYEYGFVDYYAVRDTLEELLGAVSKGEGVGKDAFLDSYTSEPVSGSNYFGERLFKRFDADADGVIKGSDMQADSFDDNLAEYEISNDGLGGRDDEAEEGEGEDAGEMVDGDTAAGEDDPQSGEEEGDAAYDDLDFDSDDSEEADPSSHEEL